MKIAMIGHKRVPGGEGGVEVVVEALAVRMAAAGHAVTLYNRAARGIPKTKSYRGCRVVTVPTINKKSLDAVVYSLLATLHALFGGYDVLHYHALGPSVMLALPHALGRRTVATVHGLDWQRAKWGGFGTKYLKLGEKVIAKYADEVIVLSEGVQDYFRTTYGRETTLLPNGVDEPPACDVPATLQKWGLVPGEYLLFLARIVPEKGLHTLLEAFAGLNTDKKLVIAGGDSHSGGYYEEMCQKADADGRCVRTGFVRGADKAALLAGCALYVLPSEIEGLPLSLLEAMAAGAPCLVSDIAENLAPLGAFGAHFAVGSVPELQKQLAAALQTPPPAGEAQAAYVRQRFSWDEVTRRTLALYAHGQGRAPEGGTPDGL